MVNLDDTDWAIVRCLQRDGRLSFRQLATQVHLSPAATTARVHALVDAGVVTGFHAHVDPERIGRTVRAFVRLTASTATTRSVAAAEEIGREHPAVQEVFLLLGDADLLFYVEATSLHELDALVTALGALGQTATSLVVNRLLHRDDLGERGPSAG